MAEFWKSTPNYFCKDCGVYVRDTNLGRANHEATARHRNARQRTLRNVHIQHEKDKRDKYLAQREIERVTGLVTGETPRAPGKSLIHQPVPSPQAESLLANSKQRKATNEERQAQLEQLVAMGVEIPNELKGNLALAGEWQVTKTRIITDKPGEDMGVDATAVGIRGRKRSADYKEGEEQAQETEEALRGLFAKKKRMNGRGCHTSGRDPYTEKEGEQELEGLLANFGDEKAKNVLKKEEEAELKIKKEYDDVNAGAGEVNQIIPDLGSLSTMNEYKQKEEEEDAGEKDNVKSSNASDCATGSVLTVAEPPSAIIFKKRKAKKR